jgi:site-specific recombinase XerD
VESLKSFFESNNIPEVSQSIVEDYFTQMIVENRDLKTINYNVKIMKFVLSVIKTDLDKLTKRDIISFQAAIRNKEWAESSKKQYVIGFKRFLHWYGKNNDFPNSSTSLTGPENHRTSLRFQPFNR